MVSNGFLAYVLPIEVHLSSIWIEESLYQMNRTRLSSAW